MWQSRYFAVGLLHHRVLKPAFSGHLSHTDFLLRTMHPNGPIARDIVYMLLHMYQYG